MSKVSFPDSKYYDVYKASSGTTITAKLIENGTVVATVSLDGSISANQVYLFKAYSLNTDVLVKNIKIL